MPRWPRLRGLAGLAVWGVPVCAPAGGAVELVLPEEGPGPDDGPPSHDGGTYDGEGFWSSGLIGAGPYLEYTMRITKPGTYAYACLLHPPMVGTIKVT